MTIPILDLDETLILSAVQDGGDPATYVVRNRAYAGRPAKGLKTKQVLHRLKKLEKLGLVERVQTSYATMISWRAVQPGV